MYLVQVKYTPTKINKLGVEASYYFGRDMERADVDGVLVPANVVKVAYRRKSSAVKALKIHREYLANDCKIGYWLISCDIVEV